MSGYYYSNFAERGIPLSERRGFGFTDESQNLLFVKSSVSNVCQGLSQIISLIFWKPDCYGQRIILPDKAAFIVFKFKPLDWVTVSPINRSPTILPCSLAEMATLSKHLNTEIAYCLNSDTGCHAEYSYYVDGELMQSLQIVEEKIRGYEDLVIEDWDAFYDHLNEIGDPCITDKYCHYINRKADIDAVKVLDDYQVVGDFMNANGIYSPGIGWQMNESDHSIILEITGDGLDAGDIERLDVIMTDSND